MRTATVVAVVFLLVLTGLGIGFGGPGTTSGGSSSQAVAFHPIPFTGPAYQTVQTCYSSAGAGCTTSAISITSGYSVFILEVAANAPPTPTSTPTNTWTSEKLCSTGSAAQTEIWSNYAPSAGSTTFTLPNLGAGHNGYIMAVETTGVFLDAKSAYCSSSTGVTPNAQLVTGGTHDLFLGVWMSSTRQTATAGGGGGTLIATSGTDFSTHTGFGVYQSFATPTVNTITGNYASSTTWYGIAIALASYAPGPPDTGKIRLGSAWFASCLSSTSCTTTSHSTKQYSAVILSVVGRGTTAPSSVGDSASDSYTLRNSITTASSPSRGVWIYTTSNISANAALTLNAHFASGVNFVIMGRELQNVTSPSFDAASTGAAATGATLTQSVVTTKTYDGMFIAAYSNDTQAVCSNNGTTVDAGDAGWVGGDLEWQAFNASGTASMSINYGNVVSMICNSGSTTYAGAAIGVFAAKRPNAPTSLTAGTPTASTIPLTWKDGHGPVVNETVYKATYSGSCGAFSAHYSTGGRLAAYTATGLPSATTFCFKVFSWNTTSESANSSTIQATTASGLAASFTWSPTNPDSNHAASFISTVSGGTPSYTYAWKAGGGAGTSTAANPSLTFTSAGTWWVYLNVTDAAPTTVGVSHQVTVNTNPSVTFSASPSTPDANHATTYTSSITGGTSTFTYAWHFGGAGGTSTTANPSVTFTSAGSWHAYLNVTDSDSVVFGHNALITVNAVPSVTFSVSPITPDQGTTATYTSTVTSGTSPFTYAWHFGGGGGTSTAANPSVTFTSSGTFWAYLNVTDTDSIVAADSAQVTVDATPSVTWTAAPTTGEAGISTTFTSHVTGGTASFTYAWSLGGGHTSTATNPSYVYPSSGTFAVWLNVTDADSVVFSYHANYVVNGAVSVTFSGAPTTGEAGISTTFTSTVSNGVSAFTYAWSLGGGHISTAANPSYAYPSSGTFAVWLNVTDADGGVASHHISYVVNAAVSVTFSASPPTGEAGVTTTFTSTVSNGVGSYTYAWSLGSGVTSTAANPTHLYASAGTFAIWLNVTDADGGVGTHHTTYTVNIAVSATFSISPTTGEVGVTTTFTSTVSNGVSSFTYAWSLGSGATSTAANPTHPYGSPGTFAVWVNVTDADGAVAAHHVSYTVHAALTGSLSAAPTTTQVGEHSVLSYSHTGGVGTVTWTLERGGTHGANVTGATGTTYTFTPASAATYTFYLNWTDTDSASSKKTVVVTVDAALAVTLTAAHATTDVAIADVLTLTLSYGVHPVTWTFEYTLSSFNLTGVAGGHYSFFPVATGVVTFYLNATDSVGSTAQATVVITVVLPPVASLSSAPGAIIVPGSTTLTYAWTHGASPFHWTLVVNGTHGANLSGASGGTLIYTPAGPGGYTFWFNVTDAVGATSSAMAFLSASPPGGALYVILTAAPGSIHVGGSSNLSLIILGGTGIVTWTLTINGTPGNISGVVLGAYLFIAFHAGVYTFTLAAHDHGGHYAQGTAQVVVLGVAPPPAPSGGSGTAFLTLFVLSLMGVGVIGGSAVVVRRRRKKNEPGS